MTPRQQSELTRSIRHVYWCSQQLVELTKALEAMQTTDGSLALLVADMVARARLAADGGTKLHKRWGK